MKMVRGISGSLTTFSNVWTFTCLESPFPTFTLECGKPALLGILKVRWFKFYTPNLFSCPSRFEEIFRCTRRSAVPVYVPEHEPSPVLTILASLTPDPTILEPAFFPACPGTCGRILSFFQACPKFSPNPLTPDFPPRTRYGPLQHQFAPFWCPQILVFCRTKRRSSL
jgi:hypothetical protein